MKTIISYLKVLITFTLVHLISCGGDDPVRSKDDTVTDIDGNVYQTVRIGNQTWMAENLNVTHYRNGDPIPNISDKNTLQTGSYCEYGDDIQNATIYGRLYNVSAVNDTRGFAPEGWHVPTEEEWQQLEKYLGMDQVAVDSIGWRGTLEGNKLKETGTTHWEQPNNDATNETGFNALPGGKRNNYSYIGIKTDGYFLSSTTFMGFENKFYVLTRQLNYNRADINRNARNITDFLSVRCIKDE